MNPVENSETERGIISSGDRILLRDRQPADLDHWLRWWEGGEWQRYDAPWELEKLAKTEGRREKLRESFLQSCEEEPALPRKHALIASEESRPLGWVNRYVENRFPDAWLIGIEICEDECLNRGLGTAALRLWIGHLFTHSTIHRLGLRTYSFNPRMIRAAEKAGFRHEGTEREMIHWQGQWLDRIYMGLLREEWD